MADNTPTSRANSRLELRGKPPSGVRFGKKAGLAVGGIAFAAMALTTYGIMSRETKKGSADDQKGALMAAGDKAAGDLYNGIPDGMILPPAPPPPPPAPEPKVEPAPRTLTPQAALPPTKNVPTAEELEAMRIAQQRAEDLRRAMGATASVEDWRTIGGGSASGSSGPAGGAMDPAAANLQALGQVLNAVRGGQGQGQAAAAEAAAAAKADEDPNKQLRKEAFLAKAEARPDKGYLPNTVKAQISPYELKTTAVIPAVLITGINSDLPGDLSAQVTDNIYDSATGRYLLIPKGTTVYGTYDSQVAYGQSRVLVEWSRLQFPNGSTLNIGGMTGGDRSGYAGFNDEINNHYGRIIGYGVAASLFSAAFTLSQPKKTVNALGVESSPSPSEVAASRIGVQLSDLGIDIAKKNLQIQPTLEIRPGYQFVVKVNKDVVFPEPYKK